MDAEILQCYSGRKTGSKCEGRVHYIYVKGRKTGRPMVTDRPGFPGRCKTILERLNAGEISRRRAARELDIGYATLKRMLDKSGAYHVL